MIAVNANAAIAAVIELVGKHLALAERIKRVLAAAIHASVVRNITNSLKNNII